MAGGTGCIGKLAGRMQDYLEQNITEMPLGSPFFRKKVSDFLAANGLREDVLDSYFCIQDQDGNILAGAGIQGDIIKCVAVASEARSGGLVAPIVTHILQWASAKGLHNLKVFTKPENEAVFASLGFHTIARAKLAILMENGRGLEEYCAYLESQREEGSGAVIVMNANPFHYGHWYLIRSALKLARTVYVIVVKEDVSLFSYSERLQMVKWGIDEIKEKHRVKVLEGSSYQISAATFPSYFLKKADDATPTQMELDLDLFRRHIAPALGATMRVVGSEEKDPLTASYNEMMERLLPECGIQVEIIRRYNEYSSNVNPITASEIRECIHSDDGFFRGSRLCPQSSIPFLVAERACWSLTKELDAPLKPGLVCPNSNGAHRDMDYALMKKSIAALRPWFGKIALESWSSDLISADKLICLGKEADRAMLYATGGVNTHRGAVFALGLTIAAYLYGQGRASDEHVLHLRLATLGNELKQVMDCDSSLSHTGRHQARQTAYYGYDDLFRSWLPYYRESGRNLQKTLLTIMSTLDDTCVEKRSGYVSGPAEVKSEARNLLDSYSEEALARMCDKYARRGISPGGAADMLSLTIYADALIFQNTNDSTLY